MKNISIVETSVHSTCQVNNVFLFKREWGVRGGS